MTTAQGRMERWPTIWAAIAGLLLLIAGGFAIAYLHASTAEDEARLAAQQAKAAAVQAQRTADCVNNILAVRSSVAAADTAAYKAFIDGVGTLMALTPDTPPAVRNVVLTQFAQLTNHVRRVLARDNVYRAKHPVGRCS